MNNPYAAPTADLSQVRSDGQLYTPKMFALSGRIGRVRYLAYTMFLSLIVVVFAVILTVGLAFINPLLSMLGMLAYLPALAIGFIMAMRRLHDMDQSGWWSLLSLIPIANIFLGLWLVFGPGNEGTNSFGLPPSPNTRLIILGAWLPLVLAAVLGVLAAIAIPAYKDYVVRANGVGVGGRQAPAELLKP